MLLAYRLALASDRITATAIEATEFPSLAEENSVFAVPKVVLAGVRAWEGNLPESEFVRRLTTRVA